MLYKILADNTFKNRSSSEDEKFIEVESQYSIPRRRYHQALDEFSDVYTVKTLQDDFYDNFSIDASEFKKITDFLIGDQGDMTDHINNHGRSRLGLKFIHQYDSKHWYLYMVACKIEIGDNDDWGNIRNNEYEFTLHENTPTGKKGYWLKGTGSIAETDDFQTYNNNYFNHFLYSGLDMGNTAGNIVYQNSVKHIVFSYMEIQQLFGDNNITYNDADEMSQIRMCFSSVTFENINTSSSLKWPHTIVLHLNKGGVDLLTNHVILAATPLRNAAADYGTMHPPSEAHKYKFPPNIS